MEHDLNFYSLRASRQEVKNKFKYIYKRDYYFNFKKKNYWTEKNYLFLEKNQIDKLKK
jgi:hypothetical protein